MEKERIKELERREKILENCVGRFWEYWENEDLDTVDFLFRKLGFNEKDYEDFGIKEEFDYMEYEIEPFKGAKKYDK